MTACHDNFTFTQCKGFPKNNFHKNYEQCEVDKMKKQKTIKTSRNSPLSGKLQRTMEKVAVSGSWNATQREDLIVDRWAGE